MIVFVSWGTAFLRLDLLGGVEFDLFVERPRLRGRWVGENFHFMLVYRVYMSSRFC
jgi:hypothetical protein